MIHKNYWCVVGRMHGDDEDHIRFFYNCTQEDAVALFHTHCYEDVGMTLAEREQAAAEDRGVYVTRVLFSDSPIEEAS